VADGQAGFGHEYPGVVKNGRNIFQKRELKTTRMSGKPATSCQMGLCVSGNRYFRPIVGGSPPSCASNDSEFVTLHRSTHF
jgi:hypothetical protein